MHILIGTKNHFKIKEMMWHLEGLEGVQIHTLDELSKGIEVKEEGITLKENAEKKALELSKHTDWLVFASDAGVALPGLGDKWDMTRPKRMVGEHSSERERIDTLLKIMSGLKGDQRKCIYHVALALAHKGKLIWSAECEAESGVIVSEDHTDNITPNAWMGVVWYYPEIEKTDYQLTPEERTLIRQKFQQPLKQALLAQLLQFPY